MKLHQEQLLALIRAGLKIEKPDLKLFETGTDWEALYQAAKEQTVLGIAFDGLSDLPQENKPPRNLYLKWCNQMLRIEEQNKKLDHEIGELYALLRSKGIEPILMKGQGVARNYPNPQHRTCGDIDLYIGPENYGTVNALLQMEATRECEENYKHTHVEWHGVEVEIHQIMISLSTPWYNRHLQKDIADWKQGGNQDKNTHIAGTEVSTPPAAFNSAFLLMHALHHFLNEGIGLRQVCDWACELRKNHNPEKLTETANLLKRYGLTRGGRIFGALVVTYLHLPQEYLPLSYTAKDLQKAQWLLEEIWAGGNFGHHDQRIRKRPKGYWGGKWYTFSRALKRCTEMWSLSPSEACFYPLALACHSAQMQIKFLGRKGKE